MVVTVHLSPKPEPHPIDTVVSSLWGKYSALSKAYDALVEKTKPKPKDILGGWRYIEDKPPQHEGTSKWVLVLRATPDQLIRVRVALGFCAADGDWLTIGDWKDQDGPLVAWVDPSASLVDLNATTNAGDTVWKGTKHKTVGELWHLFGHQYVQETAKDLSPEELETLLAGLAQVSQ